MASDAPADLGRNERLITTEALGRGPTLVVAPHPDDESVGCGGWLLRLREMQMPSAVAYCTMGSERRQAEAQDACRTFAPSQVANLGLPELTRWTDASVGRAIAQLAALLDALRPAFVLVPNLGDPHQDHRASHVVVRGALRATRGSRVVVEYEGFTPLPRPNRWIDISGLAEAKRALLRTYASQDRRYRLADTVLHLNAFRGHVLMRPQVTHAEAFHLQDVEDYLHAAA